MQLHLDFQFAMVLRISVEERTLGYRWVDRVAAPEKWLALRRAIASTILHPVSGDTLAIPVGRRDAT